MSILCKKIGLAFGVLALGLSAGCGREIPEGYAKVHLSLGASEKALSTSTTSCVVPKLFVKASGIDPSDSIRVQLFPVIDVATLSGAIVGGDLFSPASVDLLLPKGVQRRLSVFGVVFDNCDQGTISYPIYGRTDFISINGPMSINADALLWSQGMSLLDSINSRGVSMIDVSQTQFVVAELDWGAAGFAPNSHLLIHDTEAAFRITPNLGLGGLGNSTLLTQVGPLFPNRVYDFEVVNLVNTSQNKKFRAFLGEKPFQSIVVP